MKKPALIDCIQHIHYFIVRHVEEELRKYKLKQIGYSHYEIIRLLHIHPKLTMKELSISIAKHKSTVTALVKKLISMDYISLTQSKKDGRQQIATLNRKGLDMRGLINSIEQKLLIRLHQQLSKQEQDLLLNQLTRLLPQKK